MPESDPTVTDAPETPPTLEALLADLDDDRRKVILDQVAKSRNEAKNLRTRLKDLEPKASAHDAAIAASKTAEEKAQEALTAAESRAATAVQRIARAEVKAALAAVVDNPDAIIEDLNLARFVDADGEVDTAAVTALVAKYAGFSASRAPRPDRSQASGANGKTTAGPAQEFEAFLKNSMSGR